MYVIAIRDFERPPLLQRIVNNCKINQSSWNASAYTCQPEQKQLFKIQRRTLKNKTTRGGNECLVKSMLSTTKESWRRSLPLPLFTPSRKLDYYAVNAFVLHWQTQEHFTFHSLITVGASCRRIIVWACLMNTNSAGIKFRSEAWIRGNCFYFSWSFMCHFLSKTRLDKAKL